ncbi:MAG TPA: hypothetical protein ENK11_10080 [Phycisphaerales bacterium]|nr:hypothetical protein [Phycisphaerales bacterium]
MDNPASVETPETGANDLDPISEADGEITGADGGVGDVPAEEGASDMPDDPDMPDTDGAPASGTGTQPDVLEEVQAELEQALAESASDASEPDADEPAGASAPTSAPASDSAEESEAQAGRDDAPPDGPPSPDAAEAETAVAGYGDIESLDDELAALACDALDDDLEFDEPMSVEHTGGPAEPGNPPASSDSTAAAAAPDDPEQLPDPVPEQARETVAAVAEESAEPASTEPHPASANPAPKKKARPKPDPGTLRWGWLPPKPEWEEVYSRWRVAIIAWRHLVWIVPPLAVFLGRWIIGHVVRLEPVLLKVAAAIAAPLSKREARMRSVVGWFAVYTFFCAACLWAYLLLGRTSTPPEATTAPIMLEGEHAVAEGGPNP